MRQGEWTDWVVHAVWSYHDDGLIEVWQNGTKIVSRAGPNAYNDLQDLYFKMGLYIPQWNDAGHITSQPVKVIYHDELRIGSGVSDFRSVMPGRASN